MKLILIRQNMTQLELPKNILVLFSYSTPVAVGYKNTDKYIRIMRTEKKWSNTTTRHINKWIEGFASKQIVVDSIGTQPQEYFDNLLNEVN